MVLALVLSPAITAQAPVLPAEYDTEGPELRRVFAPVVAEARSSVVRLRLDGAPAALGTVVAEGGWVLTKASEVRPATGVQDAALTAELADGRTVSVVRIDEDRRADVALLRVEAEGLAPVRWKLGAAGAERVEPALGSWVVVPGLSELPAAVGIVSAAARPIPGVRLGISLADTRRGVMIGGTLSGMGADEAGLERGDVIVSVGNTDVNEAKDVIDAVQQVSAGDVLPVVVERGGQRMSFDVEMRLRPHDPRSRADRMNTMGNQRSRRRDGFASVFQHDATIAPNQCGGPVLDLDGRALGINLARAGRVEAFALPAADAQALFEQLRPRQTTPEAVSTGTE
jgi:serine protease Do